ncbi:Hypothetical protein PHPALM_8073 [Phytophthora palmivora]|uniref:BED-type domain-containing protein n=1 Tax=Phytophthora palmivora TaxID=4796 RepID=A0A2P4YAQ7_9STRA|nr:Hypothetical protein PHPALM_8073 [Phytophthora palmivora]
MVKRVPSGSAEFLQTSSASVTSSAPSTPAGHAPPLANGPASVSAVWSYFEKDQSGNSICKFCDRVIKGHHSSNLLSHLRTAGRTDPTHQQANNVCEEHRETKRHIKRQKLGLQAVGQPGTEFMYAPPAASQALAAAVAAAGGSPGILTAALKRDPTAAFYTPALVQPMQVNAEQFTQDLALMALMDNLPLNYATKPGMTYVMNQLLGDKKLPLPSEEAVGKSILLLQESVFLTTKMVLARAKSVAVSLELWQHPSSTKPKPTHLVPATEDTRVPVPVPGPTAVIAVVEESAGLETVKTILDSYLERLGIKDKVIACFKDELPEKVQLTAADLPSLFVPINFDGRLVSHDAAQNTLLLTSAVHHPRVPQHMTV